MIVWLPVSVNDLPHHSDGLVAALVVENLPKRPGETIEIDRIPGDLGGLVDQLSDGGIVELISSLQ